MSTCGLNLRLSDLSINSLLGCICKIFTAIVVVLAFALNMEEVCYHLHREMLTAPHFQLFTSE